VSDPRVTDEAVDKALDVVMDDGHNGLDCRPGRNLGDTVRAALEAAMPLLAPQPVVDREALISTFLETFDKGGLWDGLEPEAYKVRHRTKWATAFADAVLALINGTAK
jgi:hypothetical protein